jgi:predicted AlkP superfamily phosphohydrolase/phosphomutase
VALRSLGALAALLTACERDAPGTDPSAPRVLLLGMDGLDPDLMSEMMQAGRLPHFARLRDTGAFAPLATSMPPQSPVAWSNLISGGEPDTHQIYDFIHRDPNPRMGGLAIRPYESIAQVAPPRWILPLGAWQIPLRPGRTESLRQGPAFWDFLVAAGIETAIYRMPANYPPPDVSGPGRFRCLCGMGTPDLLGSYGEFTEFRPDVSPGGRRVAGGRFARLDLREHRGVGVLEGPGNFLRRRDPQAGVESMRVEFEVVRDSEADVVKVVLQDTLCVLKRGEWSDWLPVRFDTQIPGGALLSAARFPTTTRAIVRFYVKSVHPALVLYATPLNLDPSAPAAPISTPLGFAAEIAERSGPYYTTGIPEDTKALRSGALDEDEFLAQVRLLVDERNRQYRAALHEFRRGFLFYYWGHTDQLAHIFWRDRDPEHPGRDPRQGDRYRDVVERTYEEMDELLGETLALLRADDVLLVVSDHGFGSFRRGLNLNRWLVENGYMSESGTSGAEAFVDVDWSATRAYALGINSLYLNLRGREGRGIVEPRQREELLRELSEKLLALRDVDGQPVIETIYDVRSYYPKADPRVAPDLLIGYARDYRASWATVLGGAPPALFEDNRDRWSGDHCVAAHLVPGVFFSNRPLVADDPRLTDVAPTVLRLLGVPPPPEMRGRAVLAGGA